MTVISVFGHMASMTSWATDRPSCRPAKRRMSAARKYRRIIVALIDVTYAPYDRHQRVWSHGVDDELSDRSTELQACDVGCTQIPPDPHRRNLLRDKASARFRSDDATTGVSDSFGAGDCRTTEPTRAPPLVAGC